MLLKSSVVNPVPVNTLGPMLVAFGRANVVNDEQLLNTPHLSSCTFGTVTEARLVQP